MVLASQLLLQWWAMGISIVQSSIQLITILDVRRRQLRMNHGKAENSIKVLCNIARTNIVASGLAVRYLARAITHAADVSNVQYWADRSPAQANPNLSPFQHLE